VSVPSFEFVSNGGQAIADVEATNGAYTDFLSGGVFGEVYFDLVAAPPYIASGAVVTLADLFDGHGQLLVYHLMFGPDWSEACKSCSFWADNFNGIDVHLAHRDTALVAVSRAPLATLEAYAKRMGWSFRWVSSGEGDFNFDYKVSSRPGEAGMDYNFGTMKVGPGEMPGFSAFRRGDDGAIYHTYSTYARGVDMLNGAYHLLDLTSKGRDESELPFTMDWVKRRDQY